MIPASHFGGLNHVAPANLNAASAPIGMFASSRSGKHRLGQSIAVTRLRHWALPLLAVQQGPRVHPRGADHGQS
jgi:hypothetical protein